MARFVLHSTSRLKEVIDREDIYYIEAVGGDTAVRLRGRERRPDTRPLDEIEAVVAGTGFFRIHRSYLVNLDRVEAVRMRASGRDWEVVMEPPVNKILPVKRGLQHALIEALEAVPG